MCWNADISLNTFLFGLFALLFVFFTQTFSKYKIALFSNPFIYVFLLEVISVQFVEFLLWRNLNNKRVNGALSYLCSWLVGIQPPTLALLIEEPTPRNTLLVLYGILVLVYYGFRQQMNPSQFHTTVAKNGHLKWNWLNLNGYENTFLFAFLAFYLLPMIFIRNNLLTSVIVVTMAVSLYFYYTAGSFGSMWCWMSNVGFLLLLVYILLVLPFK